MSASTPGAAWQHPELVSSFLDRRAVLIPLLDVQEDLLRRVFSRQQHAIGRFLDVGCGDGAIAELVLSAHPGSEAVLLDFSEPMLSRARTRLRAWPGRWQTVLGDLRDPAWREGLPAGRYDAVVSALAIHHLPAERKRGLFAELFALLEAGGLFVNMDYVSIDGPLQGLFDEQMLANAVHDEQERGGGHSEHELDLDDNEDQPNSAEEQVQWLRDAGYEQAELYFKWAEAAVFGAVKPLGGRQ
jgi:tRNA (cmo5U34)-methyltransferase